MQLKKVYFDAYRSLVDTKLEISDNCIGLVGINESGKSNILKGIACLSSDNQLTIADTPKMAKTNPLVRFEFHLDDDERNNISGQIAEWLSRDAIPSELLDSNFALIYHVEFDRDLLVEIRYLTVIGVSIPKGFLVQKVDAKTDSWEFLKGDISMPLKNAILIETKEYQFNIKSNENSKTLSDVYVNIETLESELEELYAKITELEKPIEKPETTEKEESETAVAIPISPETEDIKVEIQRKNEDLKKLKQRHQSLEKELKHFNLAKKIIESQTNLISINESIEQIQIALRSADSKITEIKKVPTPTEPQKQELVTAQKSLQEQKSKLQKSENSKIKLESQINALNEPLAEKYSNSVEDLATHLGNFIEPLINQNIPKVVFWQHKDEFILKGETEFETIKKAKSLSDISRPLINLFRIALDINSIESLRTIVAEIQGDLGERRTYESILDKKINRYIKSVWQDYDQRIKITLEKERIVVQFFDPQCDYASYFEMQERSQGCQTFISFLLTIGAEAKQGIIRDTVLLLDEPEIHLHPSGVRYMLQELIKAAKNGNKVIFATHSIFMIDREYYNRHAIVSKEKEKTTIHPSSRDRVGFFMQEEVLYSALDINLNKDFDSTNLYNFVFEGDCDVTLFKRFYEFQQKSNQPFSENLVSFYQGGKCSDIKKYFSTRPIQLGSTWVFILDSDEPANDLKKFLEGKYKQYINQFIFIFQYKREGWYNKIIEFEDLMPDEIIKEAIRGGAEVVEAENTEELIDLVNSQKPFTEYFHELSNLLISSDKKLFKENVKTKLNTIIAEKSAHIKKSDFSDKFTHFDSWGKAVIESIKTALQTQKKSK